MLNEDGSGGIKLIIGLIAFAARAIVTPARANPFLSGHDSFAVADMLHVLVERKAREDAVLFGFPAAALLVPDAADLLGLLVRVSKSGPVEVFLMNR